MPIRNGIVWPAEDKLLMPWILFHLMVSSVAAMTVLAMATLNTDCNLCRASMWLGLWPDQRGAIETFGVRSSTEALATPFPQTVPSFYPD